MGNYHVDVNFSGRVDIIGVEAYSPIEAAFLAGAHLAVGIVLRTPSFYKASIALPESDTRDAMVEALQDELSSVLVKEERYAEH